MNRPSLGVFPPGEWKSMVGELGCIYYENFAPGVAGTKLQRAMVEEGM